LDAALRDLPDGPILDPKSKLRGFKPKPGEAYGRIEAPKDDRLSVVSEAGAGRA